MLSRRVTGGAEQAFRTPRPPRRTVARIASPFRRGRCHRAAAEHDGDSRARKLPRKADIVEWSARMPRAASIGI